MREPRWRRYLRFWRANARGDVDEELAFHVDERVAELTAAGMSRVDAEREARARLGDVAHLRDDLVASTRRRARRRDRIEWLHAALQDARIAVRGFRREPMLVAGVLVALAIGIGANAAIFSMIDRLLLRPPEYVVDPERVVRFYFARPTWGGEPSSISNYPLYQDVAATPEMESAAAYFTTRVSVGEGSDAWEGSVTIVTSTFFPMLGVRPELGRAFTAEEERTGFTEPGVVLSDEVWRARYGADPGILGRRILIGGSRYPVVGIAPPRFTGVELRRVDAWLPMSATEHGLFISDWATNDGSYFLTTIGRLRSGARVDVAARDASTLFRRAIVGAAARDANQAFRTREAGVNPDSGAAVVLAPIVDAHGDGIKRTREAQVSLWLGAVSLAMLLIAGANVATLLLLRGMRRRREVAVRRALGMSAGRLLGQLAVESLVLAATAGLATLAAMHWIGAALYRVLMPEVLWRGWTGDGRILLVVVGAVVVLALATALIPALALARRELADELRTGGHGATWHRSRAQGGLLFVQAALSVALVVGAGLFVRSLQRARGVDYGFDLDRVLIARPEFPKDMADTARGSVLTDAIVEHVRRVPGVTSVALGEADPFGSMFAGALAIPGRDRFPEPPTGGPYDSYVTPDYFSTLGIAVLRGRAFGGGDVRGAPPVLAINKATADWYWRGADPVGTCVKMDDKSAGCMRIVAVVENTRHYGLNDETPRLMLYRPWAQLNGAPRQRTIFVRTSGDATSMELAVRRAAQSAAPDVPYVSVRSLGQLLDPQLQVWKLGASMLSAFGVLAIVLAAIGLYSVVAYGATQRTRELGIRVALGAQRSDVARVLARDGMRVVALGAVAGLGLGVLLGHEVGDLLFQTSDRDPMVIVVAALVLIVVAAAASAVPALRASRPDLNVVLRGD